MLWCAMVPVWCRCVLVQCRGYFLALHVWLSVLHCASLNLGAGLFVHQALWWDFFCVQYVLCCSVHVVLLGFVCLVRTPSNPPSLRACIPIAWAALWQIKAMVSWQNRVSYTCRALGIVRIASVLHSMPQYHVLWACSPNDEWLWTLVRKSYCYSRVQSYSLGAFEAAYPDPFSLTMLHNDSIVFLNAPSLWYIADQYQHSSSKGVKFVNDSLALEKFHPDAEFYVYWWVT